MPEAKRAASTVKSSWKASGLKVLGEALRVVPSRPPPNLFGRVATVYGHVLGGGGGGGAGGEGRGGGRGVVWG